MKHLSIIPFCILVLSCNSISNSSNQNTIEISSEQLIGSWTTGEWEMYHTLIFEDSQLVIDNLIDTIFRFEYHLNGQSLILTDYNNDTITVEIKVFNLPQMTLKGFNSENNLMHYTKTH